MQAVAMIPSIVLCTVIPWRRGFRTFSAAFLLGHRQGPQPCAHQQPSGAHRLNPHPCAHAILLHCWVLNHWFFAPEQLDSGPTEPHGLVDSVPTPRFV
jgi:hypothetical protein